MKSIIKTDVDEFNSQQENLYFQQFGIRFDIQNIGKNDRLIVKKEKETMVRIRHGLVLKTHVFNLDDGSFSNVYDLCWNPEESSIVPTVYSSDKVYYLKDQIEKDASIVAVMNGSFFFLTDEADSHPKELPYNLCIRNGNVISLPITDDPILFIKNNKLHGSIPSATGTMKIGDKILRWIGERSKLRSSQTKDAILFNSRSSEIIKVRDKNTGLQIGILDNTCITTPRGSDVFDLVIRADKNCQLYVHEINRGGGTHYFAGLFILQIKGTMCIYRVGEKVQPLTLDKFDISEFSEALTVGKNVHDPFFREAVRAGRKDTRSLVAKDVNNNFHFVIFDGSKYIPGFKGVSADDIAAYFSPDKFQWAYFLDGGGSSRIIVRHNNELNYVANRFVVTKMQNGKFLWDWQKARPLASSIVLRLKSSD